MADRFYGYEIPEKLEYIIQNSPAKPIFNTLFSWELVFILQGPQEGPMSAG